MKMLTIVSALVLSAGVAQAHVASSTGGTRTPAYSSTQSNTSDTSAVYKQAVLAAQDEAVMVLATDSPTDSQVFFDGAFAAGKLLGVSFETQREAAIAILSIANQ